MESVTCQGHYQEITEDTQLVKFLPVLLNLLTILYTNLTYNKEECSKVVRIVLAVQYLYTGVIYCAWGLCVANFVYVLVLLVNFESLFDLSFSLNVKYVHYSSNKWSTLLQLLMNFCFLLPDSNSVSAPYALAGFSFVFTSRFLFMIKKTSDRSAIQYHFMLLKYIPIVIALSNTLYICYFDNKVYLDHIIVLGVICFNLGFRGNLVEIKEIIRERPKLIRKEKVEEKFNYFELRPKSDGGEQGKSALPYYIDEDGDIANEFYEEVNNKLVKVSIDKLKLA